MSVRDVMLGVLRGEVDAVERGTDHLTLIRGREVDRESAQERLRREAHQVHPMLAAAVKRRRKVM